LAGAFALAKGSLPAALVGTGDIAALEDAVAVVPPFAALGLECRLSGDDQAVDLQLGARRHESRPVLGFLSQARRDGRLPSSWEPVELLCREWLADDGPLAEGVHELWCELDPAAGEDAGALAALLPSVFVVLNGDDRAAAELARERALEVLVGDAHALRGVVDRCAQACRGGAWLSHMGVMLGRSVRAVRVHVSGLPLHALRDFLAEIAWPGEIDPVVEAAHLLLDHGDELVLCFDIVDDLLPRLGLEVFFAQRAGLDPRWEPLLERLVQEELASVEKVDGLLGWPGMLTPLDVDVWPDAFILRELVEPPHRLGVLERRLSHVKITIAEPMPPSAKAYFGAGHVFRNALPRPAPHRPEREPRPAGSVAEAIDAGLAFLLERRNQAGWWRDFFDRGRPPSVQERVTGYSSDEWVTAYVATMLTTLGRADADAAADAALTLLLGRRRDGGWGYHALLPADSDTTVWVLRLAAALGAPESDRLRQARRFVAAQTDPRGAVATYPAQAAPALASFLEMPGSYDGWCAAHVCVTAAAGVLGFDDATVSFLLDAQRPDGSWGAHWWDDDPYATLRAVEVLEAHGETGALRRARRWTEAAIGADGAVRSALGATPSAFATALAASTLRIAAPDDSPGRERAVAWLLSHQQDDGSWPSSARLRVPAPEQTDPLASPATTLTYLDDEALFTTATVLAALAGA
jgi:hypothetical protein